MSDERADYPSPARAWYIVILLTLAYILSFVDRYIFGLLVEPIKADLNFSDTEIGLLYGTAFGLLYAFAGLPLGWLADRWKRTWIVGIGVAVWSAATVATGLARQFWTMFLSRMTVGVGEATLSPCTMSIIADSFPKERRGKPIAVYTTALSIGSAIASLVGAGVLVWAKANPDLELPFVGTVAAWQMVFFIVGIPGIAFALLFFFLKEPKRQIEEMVDPTLDGDQLWHMLGYVGRHWAVYVCFISLVCVMISVAYAHSAWLPAMYQRTWGWPPEQYAFVNAFVLLSCGPTTVYATGWLSDRWVKAGDDLAPLTLLIIGVLVLVPSGIAAPLMPDPVTAFVFLAINIIGTAMASAVGITALLPITPARIRAQTVALYYLVISLVGLFIVVPLTGVLSDYLFGPENLRYTLAFIPALFGAVPMALIPVTRRLYLRQKSLLEGSVARSEE